MIFIIFWFLAGIIGAFINTKSFTTKDPSIKTFATVIISIIIIINGFFGLAIALLIRYAIN